MFFTDLFHCLNDVGQFFIGHGRVKRNADETGFFGKVAFFYQVGNVFRFFRRYIQQEMAVSPRTGTTAPDLDAKAVVQQLDDQVKMDVLKPDQKEKIPSRFFTWPARM